MKKTILITGCSSGIGYESAKALQNEYKVIATARKEVDVARLKAEGFEAYKLDVTKSEEIDSVLETILQKHTHLYAIFNNAGYGQPGAIEDITKEALREQFETNFFGMWELTTKAIKIFRVQGYGRIINHSSVLGLVSLRFRGAYNATKYAIEALDDTLRLELAGSDIYVSTINTGPVRSRFRENAIEQFIKNVDYQNSFWKKEYEAELIEVKESSTAPFSRDSSVVIANIRHALQAKKPRAHYYNTEATWILATLKRVLPTSWLDYLLLKI
ncbi:Putative NAD(P)-dependent oxidoreductase EC-YbbO [hydrothermal vent metagenome]|uniref:Putative NAD(P)-dependent oxidoreductase EC-YbbO n=1 Tax=hydrothermal vent metagenome TaxID=652676 RepID=A0A1W1B8J9_9ZZZZ